MIQICNKHSDSTLRLILKKRDFFSYKLSVNAFRKLMIIRNGCKIRGSVGPQLICHEILHEKSSNSFIYHVAYKCTHRKYKEKIAFFEFFTQKSTAQPQNLIVKSPVSAKLFVQQIRSFLRARVYKTREKLFLRSVLAMKHIQIYGGTSTTNRL